MSNLKLTALAILIIVAILTGLYFWQGHMEEVNKPIREEKTVAKSADAAEPVAFANGVALYRYVDKEADTLCYFAASNGSYDVGGVHCIPLDQLDSKAQNFLLNY